MAEARSAVTRPRVDEDAERRYSPKDMYLAWRRFFIRRFFRTRNLVYNGLWPTSVWNFCLLVVSLLTLLSLRWAIAVLISELLWKIGEAVNLPKGLPYGLSELLLSIGIGVVFFIVQLYARRFLLRILLSYRGWMYENYRVHSNTTALWGILVKLNSGYRPLLYSCQQSLPRLPVPALGETLEKLVDSLKPLYGEDSEEVKTIRKQSQDFAATLGPKLHWILWLRSWWAPNWVTDWWEKYVYLKGRSPLPFNSNYYGLDHSFWKPTSRQISRAATVIYKFLVFKQKLDREEIEPLLIRKTVPICMAQYERLFSTTRIPGKDVDKLVHYDSSVSKHIIVLRKGIMYKVGVFDEKRKLLTAKNFEKQLEWIMHDAEKHQDDHSDSEKSLPVLTSLERSAWADIHSEYFSQGINNESLQAIEKAIFYAVLETKAYDELKERGQFLMHGDGKTIWFDKSISLIFFSNGRMGLNCEHTFADAPVIGHAMESVMTAEVLEENIYTEDGFSHEDEYGGKHIKLKTPERLIWDFSTSFSAVIERSLGFAQKNIEDMDLDIRVHRAYGKGFIKTCKVSPDAYIQVALQLTYFKYYGKFALTYESSMTRLYLLGRTETVRSLTMECVHFIRALQDKHESRERKVKLLKQACIKHQFLYRDAMNGKGVDRHLFGLYVLSKGLGCYSEFLNSILSLPWTLSTSQQPQQQIATSPDCNLPEYRNMLGPGGGFGPVSDMGYGIAYMIAGDEQIFFHVSAKNSAKDTDAAKFMDILFESLDEMKCLFDQ